MEDIYMLSDAAILQKVGSRLRSVRLKQNITQQSLAEEAGVSISSVKKIEKGEIGSVDPLLRVLRTLGELDLLRPLAEEEEMSPNEYYRLMQEAGATVRKRAAGRPAQAEKQESEW